MSFEVVPVDKPADMNVIIGQAHFINTELPVLYARALGVPVVFVNRVGPLLPIGGLLGQLTEEEGALTADAVMDPARQHYDSQPGYGGWLQPGSPTLGRRSRSNPAMISEGDAAWCAFRAIGWTWGGDWRSLKDYVHFSANGL